MYCIVYTELWVFVNGESKKKECKNISMQVCMQGLMCLELYVACAKHTHTHRHADMTSTLEGMQHPFSCVVHLRRHSDIRVPPTYFQSLRRERKF